MKVIETVGYHGNTVNFVASKISAICMHQQDTSKTEVFLDHQEDPFIISEAISTFLPKLEDES